MSNKATLKALATLAGINMAAEMRDRIGYSSDMPYDFSAGDSIKSKKKRPKPKNHSKNRAAAKASRKARRKNR